MPFHFTCPHGHSWESTDADTLLPTFPETCPVCGSEADREGLSFDSGVNSLKATKDFSPPPGQPPAVLNDQTKPAWPVLTGYDILARVGRGGMGIVYKARQLSLNRIVALKFLSNRGHHWAEERTRFRIEAEAVARLQHPNIVQIHEVAEQDGQPFLVLEYVEGGSLAKRLARSPLAAAAAARIGISVARGIHAAHQQGIVHRDLKPANVLLTADGVPKIADFGLAKRLEASDGPTPSGSAVLGTPSYMAPEQASGKSRAAAPAVDVYACGAILYDLVTGRPPFKADTPLDTVLQVIGDEPVPPKQLQPKVPRDLETIILKCLHKEPARRYASALALAQDLERFLEHKPIQARPVGAWGRTLRWARRHPARAAVVLLSLVIVVGLLAAGFWNAERERQAAEDARQQRDQADSLRASAEKAEGETRRLLADSYAFTAQLAMRRGDWRTGLSFLDKALAGAPSEPAGLRLEKVRAWCALGEVSKAIREVQALAGDPTLSKQQRGLALLWHGDIVLSQTIRHAEEARREFEQALEHGLPDSQAAFARGLLAPTSPEAVEHLQKALAIDPFHQRANALLGFLLMSLGRLQEARDRVVFAEWLFPDDPTFKFLRASILALEDQLPQALAVLDQAGPRWSRRDRARARLWVESMDQVRRSIALISRPDTTPWKLAPFIGRLARLAASMRDDGGDTSQTLLLPLPPTVVRSYRQVGMLTPRLLFFNEPAKFKEFADIFRVHPEGSLYLLYAYLHVTHGNWAEAEKAFLNSANTPAVVPVRRLALVWAGMCELTQTTHAKPEKALKLKARALENVRLVVKLGDVQPDEAGYLSIIALDMRDLELARIIITQWERQAPKDMQMLTNLGQLELLCGAYGKALDVAEKMRALDPRNTYAAIYRDRALDGIRALSRRLPQKKAGP